MGGTRRVFVFESVADRGESHNKDSEAVEEGVKEEPTRCEKVQLSFKETATNVNMKP